VSRGEQRKWSHFGFAGAGSTGLMLACELRLAGLHSIVLERLPEPSRENRANGLVCQVVRMLDRRGLYQRLAGVPIRRNQIRCPHSPRWR
jgi:2-polyprenyl-6-methoxyphenol hydroxylase-like FAD-dependent oxidoreductase